MPSGADDLDAVLAVHDDLIARRGVDVWVGAVPTFTRASSLEPAWSTDADGDDKAARAAALAERLPAATIRHAPGVVEVRGAPHATSAELAIHAREVWAAARAAGLSATRYRGNGDVTDSGGGAQLALGGATPDASPFVRYPQLLPALVRYLNNHPALSYWFAGEHVGSGSRGPRPDEGARERYAELPFALERLEARADRHRVRPDELWSALAPLLVDAAGDGRRAELGLSELWSPHGPGDGKRGVVRLRAVRMPEHPEMLVALAALLRGIVARLAVADYRSPLVDWHDELHDRFALPAALALDLRHVLGDLDDHGFGLPLALRRQLEAWRAPGLACKLGDATLVVRPALETLPRLAVIERCELSIDGAGPDRVVVAGQWAQLRDLGNGVRALGVRRGVEGLAAQDPLVVEWSHAGRLQRLELHARHPGGLAYDDLPRSSDDALLRRNERSRIITGDGQATAPATWPASAPFGLDLRRP